MDVVGNRVKAPVAKEGRINGRRKRTVNPSKENGHMLTKWERRNPGVRFDWLWNQALQRYLTQEGYGLEKNAQDSPIAHLSHLSRDAGAALKRPG